MFGSDGSPIVQYVLIFAVIFAALAAIVFVVRRLTGRGLALPGRAGGRGRQPRLGIVDVYELDRARQLILLRRDNVEHLLLVGGPNDVVIERNIQRGQRPLPEASLRPEPMSGPAAGPPAEPLPDPLAGAGRLPEPPLSLPDGGSRRSEPLFAQGRAQGLEMPVVVPAPVPGSGMAPPVTLPLDARLLVGDEPGQDIPVPPRRPIPAGRSPATPAPSAQPSPPARAPFSARRLLRRTAAPALDAETGPASERASGDASSDARPEPSPAEADTPVPPTASPARRTVDPAILSDMARQLQAALARPASAVTPPAVSPGPAPELSIAGPPAPGPTPAVGPDGDPMAAATPAADALPSTDVQAAPPDPAPLHPPLPPEHEPLPEPEVAPPPPPAEAPPAPEPKAAGNPFSVEEIEAEFARLLGRPLDKRG